MKIYKKLSEKVVLDNWFRKIISKDFDDWNWIIDSYLISSHIWTNYWAMIFPITRDNEVIYIKEYRFGIEDYLYSFPVGKQELDLDIEENAKKELEEETWYIWWKMVYLWETIVANYDQNLVKYFLANDVYLWSKQKLDSWESIEVFKCTKEEFEEKIKSGLINCPLTITCYTLAKLKWYV